MRVSDLFSFSFCIGTWPNQLIKTQPGKRILKSTHWRIADHSYYTKHQVLTVSSQQQLFQLLTDNPSFINMDMLDLWAAYEDAILFGDHPDWQQSALQWQSSSEDLIDDRAPTTGFLWATKEKTQMVPYGLGNWVTHYGIGAGWMIGV